MNDDIEDFLEREQQLLGDDAAGFMNPSSLSSTTTATGLQDDWGTFEDDGRMISNLQENGHNLPSKTSPNEQLSSFSPISTMSMSSQGGQKGVGGASKGLEEEPDVIKQWRADFQKQIEKRDEKSKNKHAEIIATAKQSLERFYNDYNISKQKGIAKNRELEKKEGNKRDENEKGNVWERTLKQIEAASSQSLTSNPVRLKPSSKPNNPAGIASEKDDFKEKKNKTFGKVKDTSRMKEVLKSLIKDGSNAPGIVA